MRKIYSLIIICLFSLNFISAQTTFGWDSNTVFVNSNEVTETINEITATFISTETPEILDAGGYGGTSGNIVISSLETSSNKVTFTFSTSVDVNSILALEGNAQNIDYTFTPTGGNNSPVTASLVNGAAEVQLNWTDVTSFTVTSAGGFFGFDNLVVKKSTLATKDVNLKTIKLFPNPSSDFIEISGLSKKENFEINNTAGQLVKKGVVLANEKINILDLPKGDYLLKLGSENRTIKFIKK